MSSATPPSSVHLCGGGLSPWRGRVVGLCPERTVLGLATGNPRLVAGRTPASLQQFSGGHGAWAWDLGGKCSLDSASEREERVSGISPGWGKGANTTDGARHHGRLSSCARE